MTTRRLLLPAVMDQPAQRVVDRWEMALHLLDASVRPNSVTRSDPPRCVTASAARTPTLRRHQAARPSSRVVFEWVRCPARDSHFGVGESFDGRHLIFNRGRSPGMTSVSETCHAGLSPAISTLDPCSNTRLPPKVAPTATSAATTIEMNRTGTVGWTRA